MPERGFNGLLNSLKGFLDLFDEKPKQRKEITTAAMRNLDLSHDQFQFLFALALKRGYIRKIEYGVYQRTEQGEKLAAFL